MSCIFYIYHVMTIFCEAVFLICKLTKKSVTAREQFLEKNTGLNVFCTYRVKV